MKNSKREQVRTTLKIKSVKSEPKMEKKREGKTGAFSQYYTKKNREGKTRAFSQ